jgi:tetratricopeptide (TPR) repeat protein
MARIGDCPHVVGVYDVIDGPNVVYIVARYLAGGDLGTLLSKRGGHALAVRQAIKIAAHVARALEYAHEHAIAHRDLKPNNIFLDEHGDAFLGDFGLAGITSRPDPASVHEIVGTPLYMAPEQITGTGAGSSCDLYALGCVLYEITTGVPPFDAVSGAEVLQKHLQLRPVPPRERRPSILPALNDLILKLLEKHPSDRPASSRDVRAALEGMMRYGLLAVEATGVRLRADVATGDVVALSGGSGEQERTEPPIVGREREMHILDDAVDRARSGEPGVVLLEGEPGIGKSRLLREVRARAEAAGCLVVVGQGYEDVTLPFRPFVEALLPLAGRLSEVDGADAQQIRQFLHLGTARDAPRPLTSAGTERLRLFTAIARTLGILSGPRPILLILDDLHWADSATIGLFEHLAFAVAGEATRRKLNLVLMAGFRPAAPDHRIGRVVARLRRDPVYCQTIELSGIETPGIYELVTRLGGARPSNQLVRMIQETTEGNPLFIREVLARLDRQGALREQRGFLTSTVSAAELGMPKSVTSAIAERARKLSAPCRRALLLGSFLGSRFELRVLAAVARQPEDELVNLLDEAVNQRLLVDDGEAYHFAHPLVRHVSYHQATPTRRGRIHLETAARLEELAASEPELHLPQIAHHLVCAGSLADPAKVIEYAGRAADQALAQFAWHEAAQLLEAAIKAAQTRGLAVRDVAELHHKAGLAYRHCSDTGPCFHHFDAAIDGFRQADDRLGFASALTDRTRAAVRSGLISYAVGDIAPLEQALGQLGEADQRLRARVLGTLAQSYWLAREPVKARRVASAAIELASAEHNDRLCAELSVDLALTHFQNLRLEDSLSSYRTGLAHARRANDLLSAEQCLQRIPIILLMTGRLDEAEQTTLQAREMNLLTQDRGEALYALSTLASLATVRGDFRATEKRTEESLHLSRGADNPYACAAALAALACSRAMRGDWAGANAAMDLMLEPGVVFEEPAPIEVFTRPYRQLIDIYAGKPCLIADDEKPMIPDSDGDLDFNLFSSLCAYVEIRDAARAPGVEPGVCAALEFAERQGVIFTVGWPFLIPRIQGVAATLERRWEDAERYFTRAIEVADEAAAHPEIGRSRLDYARMLVARGRPQDRAAIAELIRRALPALRGYCPRPFELAARELTATTEERIRRDVAADGYQ